MSDAREKKLAELLVNHSLKLKNGESCLIDATDVPVSMVEELVAAVYSKGAYPVVNLWSERIERAMEENATKESLALWRDVDSYRMDKMNAYIGIRGVRNVRECSSIPEKTALAASEYRKYVHGQIRLPKTRWVVLRYPTEVMAMQANMSTREFEDFFYSVCTDVDYAAMADAMRKAKVFLDTVDKVRITGPGTDITFSIKGMPWVPCAGEANIPDGEIYSCPVKTSVNGTITYNTESTYRSHKFSDISFTFRDGKIVEAHSDDDKLINDILDTDEGARYIGEFSLGVNPRITRTMDNTLFDEKIYGSIHFTPGQAYDDFYNGNDSAVHWDIVQLHRTDIGDYCIYFDDVLVRKNGVFCISELECLNL